MKYDTTYPVPKKRKRGWLAAIRTPVKWLFLLGAFVCLLVNFLVGDEAWSITVVWAMFMLWKFIFSPDLIEYNLIRQITRLFLYVCILLLLIQTIFDVGSYGFVIPIIWFSSLILTVFIFILDAREQRHNMMPLIWQVVIALVSIVLALAGWPQMNWPMIVLGGISVVLLIIGVTLYRAELYQELKKRFHLEKSGSKVKKL